MGLSSKIPVSLNPNLSGLKKSATLNINEQCRQLRESGKEVFQLGFGQSPFPVPLVVREALIQNAHQKDYLPVRGLELLRQTVSDYWQRMQGLEYSAKNIMISPGSKELLFLIQLVVDSDLVIPSPSWVSYAPQALMIGKKVVWVKTKAQNRWLLSAEDLENVCRSNPSKSRIILINYPSNPTGASYSANELQALASVAKKYGVIILADEIYGEVHHSGHHISIARYYPEGTIVSSGLSKWCGAGGWRLGVFAFPDNLLWILDAMTIVASETYTTTSAPIQYAAVAAYSEHEEITRQLILSRRILSSLGSWIHDKLKEINVNCPKPVGAFYLFPDFTYYRKILNSRDIHDSNRLCEVLLDETGVALLPSFDFGRPSEELTARLSYVDFDGQNAMDIASKLSMDEPLNINFLKIACPRVVEATERIVKWLEN